MEGEQVEVAPGVLPHSRRLLVRHRTAHLGRDPGDERPGRDDGPLPDVYSAVIEGQRAMTHTQYLDEADLHTSRGTKDT